MTARTARLRAQLAALARARDALAAAVAAKADPWRVAELRQRHDALAAAAHAADEAYDASAGPSPRRGRGGL